MRDCRLEPFPTKSLLDWYDQNARVLPWRLSRDPYRVWLSEVMLQQTRVKTVIDYYTRWLEAFPTIVDFAWADEEVVLKLWQGLGYYSRARNMHRAAQIIVDQNQGVFPAQAKDLKKLPGIGDYTAAAIASIAFGEIIPVFDGNVIRVMSRVAGIKEDTESKIVKQNIKNLADGWISPERPGDYNQAMMELGATVCLPNGAPNCSVCPISSACSVNGTNQWLTIPKRKEKLVRRKEERTVLLYHYDGKYLIQKRPSKGLLANLWEFPSLAGHFTEAQFQNWLCQNDFPVVSLQSSLKMFHHVFTHLEWHMMVYIVELSSKFGVPQGDWVSLKTMQKDYAIPTVFSGIIAWVGSIKGIK